MSLCTLPLPPRAVCLRVLEGRRGAVSCSPPSLPSLLFTSRTMALVVVPNPAASPTAVAEWATPSKGDEPSLHPSHVSALLTTFEAERAIKTMRNVNSVIALLCMLAPFCAFFIPGGELESSSVPYARFTFTFYIVFIGGVLLAVECDIVACQVPARKSWGCVTGWR